MPPVSRSTTTWCTATAPENGGARFEQDTAIVIQPNPVTSDERMGLQLGELTVVREGGAESLHGVPLQALIAAA